MNLQTKFLLAVATAFCAHPVIAIDVIKANNTDNLNLGTSWTGGTAPGVADVAVWESTVAAANTVALGTDLSWQGIRVANPGGLVTLNAGSTLTLGNAGIDLSAATQNLTINASTTVGASQEWEVASNRTLTRSGTTTTFGTGTTLTLTGGGIVAFGGTNHTLTGAGNIVVNGASLYNDLQPGGTSAGRTGLTTLTSGIIRISTSISLFGSGAIHLDGGAIGSFNTTGRVIGSNAVNIGGNVQIGGSGVLSTGFIRFDGATDLGGATRQITAIANSVNSGFGSGAIFTGIVSNGGLTKAGSGIMTLSNNGNTFTGATTVNAGNLAISTGALASSASVTLANSGAALSLGLNGTTDIRNLTGVSGSSIRTDFTISGTSLARTLAVNQATDGTYAGSFVEGGSRPISLVKSGAAILTLTGTGSFTGSTTVSGGTLRIAGAGLLGSATYAGNVTNDATLHFDSTATQTLSGIVGGTGSLLKSNTGSLILTNNNDYAGSITVSGGTLQVGNNSTAGFIGNSATVVNNAAMVWHRSNDTNVGNNISGSGTLTKLGGGLLSLNGTNTYTGTTTISEGTLRIGNGGTSGSAGSGEIINNAALVFNRSDAFSVANVISGTGTLTKDAAGTLTLTGSSTYTGATTVAAGVLAIGAAGSLGGTSVTVDSGATLAGAGSFGGAVTILGDHNPGFSPGTQTFTAGLSYGAASTLLWELTANTTSGRGASFDAVDVTGGTFTLTSGSSIDLSLAGVDFTDLFWTSNRSWLVVDLSGSATAADSNLFSLGAITGADPTGYGSFAVSRDSGDVVLNWTAVPEPGSVVLFAMCGLALTRRRRS